MNQSISGAVEFSWFACPESTGTDIMNKVNVDVFNSSCLALNITVKWEVL